MAAFRVVIIIVFVITLYTSSFCYGGGGKKFGKGGIKLEKQRRRVVTTIKVEYGDIYDCVDIYKQPSLDHPALTDHKIQMRPSKEFLESMLPRFQEERNGKVTNLKIGLEKRCPPGTVPIRKLSRKHLTRARSSSQKLQLPSLKWNHGLDFAGISTNPGKEYHGVQAFINIYNPKVAPGEFSSAMVSLESGETPNLNQIQGGWTVNPELYGDTRTRLYTSWTTDNHQSTGCYNVVCPGFVQVNPRIPLDYVLPNISVYEGDQFDFKIYLHREKVTGHWWLVLGSRDSIVGYWPKSIFTSLGHSANTIRLGGQTFTPLSEDISPPMGNGHFENGEYDSTCFMRVIYLVNGTFSPVLPDDSLVHIVNSRCYVAADNSYKDGLWQYSFLFGGAGGKDQSTCVYPEK